MLINYGISIQSMEVKDVRFPTSLQQDGSDAIHTDPDYSVAYVVLKTSDGQQGYGLTFTLGRGNNIVVTAIETMKHLIVGQNLDDILNDFAGFWRKLTSDSQLRWLGPEKGVMHLATGAIINALYDLWGRLEKKPVWKLLADMTPEFLVSLIDFRYISDVLSKEEAIQLLTLNEASKSDRIEELKNNGYPAYTTAPGWINYSDEKMKTLCKKYLDKKFTSFKIKIGQNLERDVQRCRIMRKEIGYENNLMLDANQVFDVPEAITWIEQLSEFKPLWIEEPTSPDDVLGNARIARELQKFGIGVASGEMICNRVMFKQFFQANAFEYCQIDSARIGGINEILAVYLMAKKFNTKVCPHAGGIGLSEMVQHLQFWDFISLSATKENRFIEHVDQNHAEFTDPIRVENAHYMLTEKPGYSTELSADCISMFEYPMGSEWQRMFEEGIYSTLN
ncbi:unnamed protein product [Diamesa tonsa]